MFDQQPPTLTQPEEARVEVVLSQTRTVVWLMAGEFGEEPDVAAILASLVSRPAWQARAACRGVGTAAFFPERGAGRPVQTLAYCERCPVRSECLAVSREVPGTVGVWAGTIQLGRRGMRAG